MEVPLKEPKPDVQEFISIITGKKKPDRCPLVELLMDGATIREVVENYLGRKWIVSEPERRKTQEEEVRNHIQFWYRLGYDYLRWSGGLGFASKTRKGENRSWTEEGTGMVSTWEEFEQYPWPKAEEADLWSYEFVSRNLPEGMGLFVCPTSGFLEIPLNRILGYTNLAYLLHDDSALVEEVFNRVGETIYNFYQRLIGLPNLVGFFQGDDMGFKTSTLISPDDLRKYVLPWHKKLATLAHDHGLIYMLHACGNLESIMEDLIEDVEIDAKHSFEDEIIPVTEFKKKYGKRIGVLGGVDVDKLCRLPEKELREYIRGILKKCMEGGRYALGSGNSIASYVPVENYLIMLEEGLNWRG